MLRKIIIIILAIVIAVIAVVLLVNTTLVENDLASCDKPASSDKCQTADAIVAVSGGDTNARTRQAIAMFKAGWAKKLIFSGDSADPKAISNAEAMKRIAIKSGISPSDITIEDKSRDTKENATNTVKLLQAMQAHRVILVSSPYHLRRVKMNFQAADNAIEYQTASADDTNWHYWYFKPGGWQIAITELAGIAELSAEGK